MGFRSSDVPDEILIPKGTRARVRVEAADEVTTKGGDPMLKVRLRIVDGQYSGDSLFDQALMDHENASAKRMGLIRIRDLSRAVGVPDWDDARDLVNRVCEIEVGIEDGRAGYPAKNVVARYLPIEGSAPTFASVPHPADDPSVPF